MTNPAYNKRIGNGFELDLVKYFRSEGLDAERLRLSGPKDEGDIALKVGGLPFVIEAKNTGVMDLASATREAAVEADHYAEARGIVVPHFASIFKRRNQPVSMSYVVLPLNEYLSQIRTPF